MEVIHTTRKVDMECSRFQGLMVDIDMEDDQGTHWLRAWRDMAWW